MHLLEARVYMLCARTLVQRDGPHDGRDVDHFRHRWTGPSLLCFRRFLQERIKGPRHAQRPDDVGLEHAMHVIGIDVQCAFSWLFRVDRTGVVDNEVQHVHPQLRAHTIQGRVHALVLVDIQLDRTQKASAGGMAGALLEPLLKVGMPLESLLEIMRRRATCGDDGIARSDQFENLFFFWIRIFFHSVLLWMGGGRVRAPTGTRCRTTSR